MKKEENKSISAIIKELESDSAMLTDYPDDFVQSSSLRVKNNVNEIKISLRGVRIVVILSTILFLTSLFTFFLSIRYFAKAERIANDSEYNTITKKILGIEENDSISSVSYITNEKDSLISYPDLINERQGYARTKDSLNSYKVFQRIVKDNFGITMTIDQKKDSTSVTVQSGSKNLNKK